MQLFRKARSWWVVLVSVTLMACQANLRDDTKKPISSVDPFDYNYCGGVPVYPVIGISFSTFCGPRNQLALGRYGTLMWLFPALDGAKVLHQGKRKLSDKELKHLSLLAEVAQLADPLPPQPGAVNYRLGINFSGRATKRMHAVKDERYAPANKLFEAMLEMVPDKPALPECSSGPGFFDPNQLPGDRWPLSIDEVNRNQGHSHVLE
jgi:hypothetical protein